MTPYPLRTSRLRLRFMGGADIPAHAAYRNDPDVVRRLLTTPGRWAVVGLRDNPQRTAYRIALYLRDRLGQEIVPVHPAAETVHGVAGYPALADVPGTIDVVDVFVRSELAGAVVDQAVAVGARAVWLQLGVIDEDAARRFGQARTLLTVLLTERTCPEFLTLPAYLRHMTGDKPAPAEALSA